MNFETALSRSSFSRWAALNEVSAAVAAAVGKRRTRLSASHAKPFARAVHPHCLFMVWVRDIIVTGLQPRQTFEGICRPPENSCLGKPSGVPLRRGTLVGPIPSVGWTMDRSGRSHLSLAS